jgi:hypothetical protein
VWLVGLAGILGLGASGCIIGDDSSASQFFVDWSLAYVRGGDVTCELADTPTVDLTMINTATNQKFVDTFPCAATGGRSRSLPPGTYDVTIELKNRGGEAISKQEAKFDLVRHSPTGLPPITFEIQSFRLAWSLARGQTSLACHDVGARFVNVVTRLNSEDPITYSFPCEAGSGSSPAILLGTYSVGINLVDGPGNVLWQSDLMTKVVDENERADWGVVIFQLP